MRLISLDIKNFRVLKRASISFPDKVIGIIGPNGAGKSSIVEAIAWALYGNQAARTGKDEIKAVFARPDDNCEVTLEFLVNGQKYRAVRRLAGRTERAEVELYRGEASESVGVNETKAYVGQLLGLDWRGFLSSFLARQQELNALSDFQPSKRRDHIAGMLGIERLDRAIQRVKENVRSSQDRAQFLQSQLAERSAVLTRLEELTHVINGLAEPLVAIACRLEAAEKSFQQADTLQEQAQKKKERWQTLTNQSALERKTEQGCDEQLANLEREFLQLKIAESRLKQLLEPLAELPILRAELEKLTEVRGRAVLIEGLTSQRKSLQDRLKNIESEAARLKDTFKELNDSLSRFPDDIENLQADTNRKLETVRDEYSRCQAEQESLKRDMDKLKKQLTTIDELGPDSVCDRCLRPFGDDFHRIKDHLTSELNHLEKEISDRAVRLAEVKEEGISLRKSAADLTERIRQMYQLRVDRDMNLKHAEQLQQQAAETALRLTETDDQLTRYPAVDFDPGRFGSLTARAAQLDDIQKEYNQLKGSLGRLPIVEKSKAELLARKAECSLRLKTLQTEVLQLDFKEEEFVAAASDFKQAQQTREEVRREHDHLVRRKELAETERRGLDERLILFEKTEQELEQYRTAHYYGEKLANLFGDFRKDLIASIRPTLAEISSRLMADMTDGRYGLIELDDKYNLKVMDSGVYFGVDRFSGGEKDLANLCLRLAISVALTESAGLDCSFVILDEVFGSQDTQRKELILRALARLKNKFPQILLITHIEDIKDGVEEIIEVAPTGNGWSEVRVNGRQA